MFSNVDTNIKLGLERIRRALNLAGIDKTPWEYVLIAGTNGKGTTAKFLGKILRLHNKKTMVYTSPHLERITERVEIEGEEVEERVLQHHLEHAKLLNIENNLNLTPFELFTLATYSIAKEVEPEVLVAEVGLGGRLDATNALHNRYSIITSIGIDHTNFLGSSVQEIAKEKAGIVKEKGICIVGKVPKEAMSVIEQRATEKRAELLRWGREIVGSVDKLGNRVRLLLKEPLQVEAAIDTPFPVFAVNAALAVVCAHLITPVNTNKVSEALRHIPLPARGEVIRTAKNTVVIDTAHNPLALSCILKELEGPLHILLSPLSDKDWRKMVEMASTRADTLIMVEQTTDRGLKRGMAPHLEWIDPQQIPEVVKTLEGTVLITGSFWIARTAREFLRCQHSQD